MDVGIDLMMHTREGVTFFPKMINSKGSGWIICFFDTLVRNMFVFFSDQDTIDRVDTSWSLWTL